MIVKRYRVQKRGELIIKSIRKKKTIREIKRCNGCFYSMLRKSCKNYNYMYQTKYSFKLPRPKYYCHIISSGLYCRSHVVDDSQKM